MAWVKFAIVLPAAITWLRSMRLCVEDSDDLQLNVDSWARKIFAWGLAGILTAMLLPAWLVGAGVLIATCGIPSWTYVRWRNSHVTDPALKVGWKQFLIVPRPQKRKAPDVQFVMPFSGLVAPNVVGNMSFVGRSFSDGVVNSVSDDEGRKPSGMRTTLTLLGEALSRHATDIHVATKEDKVVVRLRIDGRIVALDPLPRETGLSLINVFKVLGDLNIADRKRAQDGSFRVDVDGRRLCFRVALQGTDTGEKLSIRILDPAANLATFPALGFTSQLEGRLESILNRSSGLVLFCGATGAGKSTTAYTRCDAWIPAIATSSRSRIPSSTASRPSTRLRSRLDSDRPLRQRSAVCCDRTRTLF
jgi:general secretion pathway protein E